MDINRINELYKKSKEVGLNDDELREQSELRREYIENIKNSLKSNIENIRLIDKDGNEIKPEKKRP